MASRVSRIYGDAYVSLQMEEERLNEAARETAAMQDILKQDEELSQFLCHPQIIKEQKMRTVENIFRNTVSDDMMGFLIIMIQKGRWKEIEETLDYIVQKIKKLQGTGVLKVISACSLSETQKKKIEKKVLEASSYDRLDVSYTTDETVLGGLILQMDNRVVDSSIRTKLDSMAKYLSKIQL